MASYRTNIQYAPALTTKKESVGRFWTNRELEKLEKAYKKKLCEAEITELFPNRSYAAIRKQAFVLGLLRRERYQLWLKKDKDLLDAAILSGFKGKKLYRLFPNRTPTAVRIKAHKLRPRL
jgi:hypothetical protein